MPVGFLTWEQRDRFSRYVEAPSREELELFFHLSDDDHKAILPLRGEHSQACPIPQKNDRRGLAAFSRSVRTAPPSAR